MQNISKQAPRSGESCGRVSGGVAPHPMSRDRPNSVWCQRTARARHTGGPAPSQGHYLWTSSKPPRHPSFPHATPHRPSAGSVSCRFTVISLGFGPAVLLLCCFAGSLVRWFAAHSPLFPARRREKESIGSQSASRRKIGATPCLASNQINSPVLRGAPG